MLVTLGTYGVKGVPLPSPGNAYTMLYLGTSFESYSETVYKGQDHIDPRMSEEFQGFVKVILSPLKPYKPPDLLCRMSV